MMNRVYSETELRYVNLCSDITLYSDARGFFQDLAEYAVELASTGEWLTNTFVHAGGDAGKIEAVLNNSSMMWQLNEAFSGIEPMYRQKDGKISQTKRLEAENALRNGNLMQALAIASQAVIMAPMKSDQELVDGGISLALALWTRSEILMTMGKPQAALEDLKQALKERLPAKMRGHYYWRVGNCHKDAGELVRAKVSYEVAARLLASNETAKQLLQKDMADMDNVKTITKPIRKKPKGASLSGGGGKQSMPSLSKLVKISEDSQKGRFATASSSINTGDVLLTESPYASCLRPDYHGSHCPHCFKSLAECEDEAPSWCPNCSGVAFCSIKCRDTAVNSYHKYECSLMDIFIGSGMSVLTHLALRMVTQAGLEGSLAIHNKYINGVQTIESSVVNEIEGASKKSRMKNRKTRLDRRQKALKNNNKEDADDKDTDKKEDETVSIEETLELKSAQIYSLCTHSDVRRPEDYLKRIVMAIFLVECLKKTTFFGQCSPETLRQHEQSIRELLLKNLQLLQFNAHEIYDTVCGKHIFKSSKIVYIAVGIYPTGALFNHECYPAVTRYFEGRDLILRAMRPLVPGDVVSENYGPHFLVRNLKQRQRGLSCRYWFNCDCIACQEDWPTLKQMHSDAPISFKCLNSNNCPGKIRANPQWPNQCPKCSTTVNKRMMSTNQQVIKTCVDQYQEGARLMDEEKAEEAIDLMTSGIDEFHKVARCPHKETHLAQESLRICFACSGNIRKVESV